MATIGLVHLEYEVKAVHPHLVLVRSPDYSTLHLRRKGTPVTVCESDHRVTPVYVHNAAMEEHQLCPVCFAGHKKEIRQAIKDTDQPVKEEKHI